MLDPGFSQVMSFGSHRQSLLDVGLQKIREQENDCSPALKPVDGFKGIDNVCFPSNWRMQECGKKPKTVTPSLSGMKILLNVIREKHQTHSIIILNGGKSKNCSRKSRYGSFCQIVRIFIID